MSNLIEESELRKIAAVGFLDQMEKEAAAGGSLARIGKAIKSKAKAAYSGVSGKKLKTTKGSSTGPKSQIQKDREFYHEGGKRLRENVKNNKGKYIAGGATAAAGTGYAIGN